MEPSSMLLAFLGIFIREPGLSGPINSFYNPSRLAIMELLEFKLGLQPLTRCNGDVILMPVEDHRIDTKLFV